MFKIHPSILNLKMKQIKKYLPILSKNKYIDAIHFDVMDGKFVKAKSFSPLFLRKVKKNTNLFMEVHLMVNDPFKHAKKYIKAGSGSIYFHIESLNNSIEINSLIEYIKRKNNKVGLVIKPNTKLEIIYPYLTMVDGVLIMSVEPGKGGQLFIDSTLDKIKILDEYRIKNQLNFTIEVDGGINNTNYQNLVNYNVDYLVMGSYLLKGNLDENLSKII